MRIGILVLAAGRTAGGPETYEVELIRALAEADGRNEYVVYCTSSEAAEAIGPLPGNFRPHVLRPSLRVVSVGITLPRRLARDGIELLHATYAPPPVSSVPLAFTMHCCSNFARPEFYPGLIRRRLNALQKVGLRRASVILCVSDFIAAYLRKEFGIPAERLRTVYNGVSRGFAPFAPEEARRRVAERFGIESPYVLYVGKLQARKNIVGLIRAYHRFRRESGSPAKLVLAGKRVETSDGIRETIDELGLRDEVVETGYLAHSALPELYAAARMTVLPSFYEGFGIPVVEAMACGSPVIASNVTSLPEIAGGAAVLVNPHSVEEMAMAMAELDRDENRRNRLIELGLRRASRFTWANCARETLAAYESASPARG